MQQRALFISVLTVLVFIVFFMVVKLGSTWDFRNNLYGPAQMITQGEIAYSTEITGYPDSVWFPTIIGQFFWLGWITFDIAKYIWMAFFTACLVIALSTSISEPKPLWLFVVLLISVFLYPPLFVYYKIGQISLYSMMLMIFSALALKRRRYWAVGLLVVLASAKPQMIILPAMGLLIGLWRQGAWQAWIRAAIASIITTIILLIPLFVADGAWVQVFLGNLGNIPEWYQPSTLQVLKNYLGSLAIWAFIPIFLATVAVNGWLWFKQESYSAMLWSLALNLIAIPYVWSWDFVVLLPLYTYYLFSLKSIASRFILIAGYIGIVLGYIYIRMEGGHSSFIDWWIPYAMIIAVLIAIAVNQYFPALISEDESNLAQNMITE